MFARSIGSAVGAAVLGAVANGVIAGSGRPETDPATATDAGTAVFVGVLVVAVLTVVAGLFMPKATADSTAAWPTTRRGIPGELSATARESAHSGVGRTPERRWRRTAQTAIATTTMSPTIPAAPRPSHFSTRW